MDEDIDKKRRESTFYAHYKELLLKMIDSYESPEVYYVDKLNDNDLDNIIMELFDDNYFNDMVDKCLEETLESYAARKESIEDQDIGRYEE